MICAALPAAAQQTMTPELLWKLGRVSGQNMSADGKKVFFSINWPNMQENKSSSDLYAIDVKGGAPVGITETPSAERIVSVQRDLLLIEYKGQLWQMNTDGSDMKQLTNEKESIFNVSISPDGRKILFSREVKIRSVEGKDFYPELTKSNVQIYDDLNYRHWDAWEDGMFQHPFLADYDNGKISNVKDLLKDLPYDCPTMPFGGAEDLQFSPDGKAVVYVTKKKFGKEYAQSTNTDVYRYDIATGQVTNLSESLTGYDLAPLFNTKGDKLAWLSMGRDGFEADKNDIILQDMVTGKQINVTATWDGSVNSFKWSEDGKKLYFVAPWQGAEHLFEADLQKIVTSGAPMHIRQVTSGDFDVNAIVGQSGTKMVVSRTDMNHAAELYTVDLKKGTMTQLTHVNDKTYESLKLPKFERRMVKTTDGKDMLAWVIYPPDFDKSKKYPTLLYCQGGPQSALSQFYSFRWNFQVMASQGYIVVAPNRRGMPGWGSKWNEDISKDWGGQPMRDYLAAIDDVSKESYVDKSRLGCVGASYGGYSVYMLAGIHQNRFKTFIAHDGLFDLKSWYGTTEELWFANYDIGGPYWDKNNAAAQKSYTEFNPSNMVDKWTAPMLIIQGGIDFRVPIEQGLQAFQAAQLKGLKSKLLYFPEENHWVVKPQNGLVWQREFFKWLKETL
jgi:dipeptidyl aminopeptidase/acylaminoacyl peptidase